MKKNVVVTGATSFIGVQLIQELRLKSVGIYAAIRPGSKNRNRLPHFPDLNIIPCDLSDVNQMVAYLPEKVDLFYHLAWEGARKPYRDNEVIQQANYRAAIQAYRVAKEKGCKKFIGVGSQAEYGKTQGIITEDYPKNPTTQYGNYKLKAYSQLKNMGIADGITVIWPRIFSVYGQYDYPGTLIMSAIEKMKNNQPLDLTECVQNWNYLYVKDIGQMLCQMGFENCESGAYNLASCDNRTLKEYVKELKQILGSTSELNFGAATYGAEGVISFQPSINKLKKAFPLFEFTSFGKGIKEMFSR